MHTHFFLQKLLLICIKTLVLKLLCLAYYPPENFSCIATLFYFTCKTQYTQLKTMKHYTQINNNIRVTVEFNFILHLEYIYINFVKYLIVVMSDS